MGPIEYALFSQAWRLRGSVLADSPSVKPELDCLAEAISDTCRHFGMGEFETADFLLLSASKVHSLDPEIRRRRELRRMERRLLTMVGWRSEPMSDDQM